MNLNTNSLSSLEAIEKVRTGSMEPLKIEKWLMYLTLTSEKNINLERLESLEEKTSSYVLNYVEKTLLICREIKDLTDESKYLTEETLKWSETAKGGLSHQRESWIKQGYNLFVHNIGSAQIYLEHASQVNIKERELIHSLILTHGYIGQFLRGEVPLSHNRPLYEIMIKYNIPKEDFRKLLMALNQCIIAAVDDNLWNQVKAQVEETVDLIIKGYFEEKIDLKERIRRLRTLSVGNGEDFEKAYKKYLTNAEGLRRIENLLRNTDLWYVEATLFDFTFEEFLKIFLFIEESTRKYKVKHISFEYMMKDIYYQYEGKKRVNIYKKRIIEKYLSEVSMEDLLLGIDHDSQHTGFEVLYFKELDDTVFFNFKFSAAGSKLIDFCMEAENSGVLYEKSIILLFDLFGFRKDKYDRFYEEEKYLSTMNQSIDYKKIILDYVTGDSILDIGPGGGALMDLLEATFPGKKITGVDISQNVLDNLKKKKQLEKKKWNVAYGDALNLEKNLMTGSVDTIIFCSILHELFSYIEYKGQKFNFETLAAALKSAFHLLKPGGRIIIRDGIMTEPVNQKRFIKFLSKDGLEFLERYQSDFKGRQIHFEKTGRNEVCMPVNDAMEFLYTYTWGEKSYIHEVKEQFGYFTPSGYADFIKDVLGEGARIIELKHYLQEGYTLALSQKIEFYDENRQPVALPESTCIVVIEKS